jgi:hypothetical protein
MSVGRPKGATMAFRRHHPIETGGLGQPEPSKSTRSGRQSSPVHADRCCNCSNQSTCKQTARCACRQANCPCINCECFHKCVNKESQSACCVVIETVNPLSQKCSSLRLVVSMDFKLPWKTFTMKPTHSSLTP